VKKTKGSGGFEPDLAADGFFGLFARAAIILRQLVYGFAGFGCDQGWGRIFIFAVGRVAERCAIPYAYTTVFNENV
jgi:hypothetical protein